MAYSSISRLRLDAAVHARGPGACCGVSLEHHSAQMSQATLVADTDVYASRKGLIGYSPVVLWDIFSLISQIRQRRPRIKEIVDK
jgi:hypothetical protein